MVLPGTLQFAHAIEQAALLAGTPVDAQDPIGRHDLFPELRIVIR